MDDIAVDAGGAVWVTAQEVLRLAVNGRWELVRAPGVLTEWTNCVTAAPDGSVWFGTEQGVAIHSDGGGWRRLEGLPPELATNVVAIAFDVVGRAWLSTEEGVGRASDDGTWQYFPLPDGDLAGLTAGGLAIEGSGRAWVTDGAYLGAFDPDGRFVQVVDVVSRPLYVTGCLIADPRGDGIWVCAPRFAAPAGEVDGIPAPFDGGLLHRRASGLWEVVSPWDGLGSMAVGDVAIDPVTGDLMAATDGGVARLALSQVPSAPSWSLHLPFAELDRAGAPTDTDEYAVYRAAIERTFGPRYARYVISDHTSAFTFRGVMTFEEVREQLPTLDRQTFDDLEARNAADWPLVDAFGLGAPVVLIGDDEVEEIFAGGGWEEFYRRYPGSQGHMAVSRVGFNDDRSQALVYLGNQSDWLAGAGGVLLLARSGDTWTVIGYLGLWVS